MHKFEDQTVILKGPNCIKSKFYGQLGVPLKEIDRWRTEIKFGKKTIQYNLHFFLKKASPITYFAAAFSVPTNHQSWQILHANDPMQFLYSFK